MLQRDRSRFPSGPDRRAVLTLAAVLALNSADTATVGAVAPLLEHDLGLDHAGIGLLAAVSALVGAVATVPAGALADRVRRTRLLAGSIVLWSLAMVAGALASDFAWLMASRLALGAVTATAGPAIASLVGDLFPDARRGQVWGRVLSGELVGAGIGLVGSGLVAGLAGWRAAFGLLAVPGFLVAFLVLRVPEPARGGGAPGGPGGPAHEDGLARSAVLAAGVAPPDRPPVPRGELSLGRAVRAVLAVPTNVRLIVASALGYFFFTGIRVFGLTLMRERFGVGQEVASVLLLVIGAGALAGVLSGGRLGDALLHRGRLDGRIVVPAGAYLLSAAALAPALLVPGLAAALPLLVLGAAGLAAANPPLDAARLDIMPGRLWGRAEGVRTVLRSGADAGAPFLFGWLSVRLAGPGGAGLQRTFLIMLVPLVAAVVCLLSAGRTYPSDVAAAAAGERSQRPR